MQCLRQWGLERVQQHQLMRKGMIRGWALLLQQVLWEQELQLKQQMVMVVMVIMRLLFNP
jgi:hypothetical protein